MPDRATLILTRPRAQSEAFAEAVAARMPGRFRIVLAPLIEIIAAPGPVRTEGAGALAFTSANGVRAFAAATPERGLPAYCVGAMTAEAARAAGFDALAADGDVEALARLIVATPPPAGPVLHVRGRHAAGDLVGRLEAAGVPARAIELYDQVARPLAPPARALLERGETVVLPFFSPRTARLFAAEAGNAGWDLANATAVSLSPAADRALAGAEPGRRIVAARADGEGMLATLAAL